MYIGIGLDHEHWARLDLWTLQEAAALLVDQEPRACEYPPTGVNNHGEYKKMLQLLYRARQAGNLKDDNSPAKIRSWAEQKQIKIPKRLLDAMGAQVIGLEDMLSTPEYQLKCANERIAQLEQDRITLYKHIKQLETDAINAPQSAAAVKNESTLPPVTDKPIQAKIKLPKSDERYRLWQQLTTKFKKEYPNAKKSEIAEMILKDCQTNAPEYIQSYDGGEITAATIERQISVR